MGDLDLEELDRAVNSLMSQRDDMKNHSGDSPVDTDGSSVGSSTVPSTGQSSNAPSQPSPSIRRPTGRFMDVMPPSAGYKARNTAGTTSSVKLSREGISLSPDIATASEVSTTEPQEVSTQELETTENTTEVPQESATTQESANAEINSVQLDSSSDVSQDTVATDELSDSQPMQTPFLSNIEVDKRPLGQTLQDEAQSDHQSSDIGIDEGTVDSSGSSDMPDPLDNWEDEKEGDIVSSNHHGDQDDLSTPESVVEDVWSAERPLENSSDRPQAAQPEEFNPEVMALESTAMPGGELDSTDSTTTLEGGVEPVETAEPHDDADDSSNISASSTSAPAAPINTGDIPRQYTPESANDPEPVGVFDEVSNEGPQPLKHPKKKKSGWLVVGWILLLLVLGVGGGAAAWFFLVR